MGTFLYKHCCNEQVFLKGRFQRDCRRLHKFVHLAASIPQNLKIWTSFKFPRYKNSSAHICWIWRYSCISRHSWPFVYPIISGVDPAAKRLLSYDQPPVIALIKYFVQFIVSGEHGTRGVDFEVLVCSRKNHTALTL